jgi:hexosaminidase
MRNKFCLVTKSIAFLFLLTFVVLSSEAQPKDPYLGIIPAPKSVIVADGFFLLKGNSDVTITYGKPSDKRIAQAFSDFLRQRYELDIPITDKPQKGAGHIISFSSENYSGTNPEGYTLTITPSLINVSGEDAGLFYGLQSLMQLPSKDSSSFAIPCAEITDSPRYKYRGVMLDVCLHMYPVSFIKELIDLMAQYKLNTFHWHLTEDQGWRIEIKKYPKLTQVGAYRNQTLIGHLRWRPSMGYDHTPYGGFYTQDEIKEVVKFAQERNITVIPEIELPGHSLAALTAYPDLACGDNPGPFKVAEIWGIFNDVYCAGKENTFTFLENVLTEVMELFPSKYIHIGGDEVPKIRWKACKYCQQRIKKNHLKNEEELQSYFVHRIEKFLNAKGRQIIGWDEILEGGLAPNATVQSWRGTTGGIAAASQKHDVIMSPRESVYFDYYQGDPKKEPLAWGRLVTLKNVYDYNPAPEKLTADQKNYIIGVEGALWTEYMPTASKVSYMLLPRMLALSEIAWTNQEQKDYKNFSNTRLPVHLASFDKKGLVYRVPAAIGIQDTTFEGEKFTINLEPSVSGAQIFYTLNGLDPGETDWQYKKPLSIVVPSGERRILKTIVITPSGKRSLVTTTEFRNQLPPSEQVLLEKVFERYFEQMRK